MTPRTLTPRANCETIAAVYEDSEALIRRIAWRFCRRYSCDFDECLAEANYQFLLAYHTHDPEKGALETRLQFVLWNRMLDGARREAKRALCHDTEADVVKLEGQEYNVGAHDEQILEGRARYMGHKVEWIGDPDAPWFDTDAYQTCADPDGRFVIGLMLDTPRPLADAIRALPRPGPRAERDCLTRYLRAQGWSARRVRVAYRNAGAFLETV